MKVEQRPVQVDAWRVTDLINRYISHGTAGLPEPIADAYENGTVDFPFSLIGPTRPERIDIITRDGIIQVGHGMWLVRDTTGDLQPVRNDVFWDTYHEVDSEPRLITG